MYHIFIHSSVDGLNALKYYFNLLLAVLGLHGCSSFSVAAASQGCSSLRWADFSLQLLLLQGTGSRWVGLSGCGTISVVVVHGLSCPTARGIFLDQVEPESPAFAGWFLSTVPPGKYDSMHFKYVKIYSWVKKGGSSPATDFPVFKTALLIHPWRNEPKFFGILVYSLVSQSVDLFSLAISGCVLTEVKLPGFKIRVELEQTAEATQAPKPSALTKSLENQSGHDAIKGPSSQSYGFSSSHVWMWELNHKESWVPKNWCFWTVVLEKTLQSPLDCKDIQPVHPKGNQSQIFIGRTDAEAETPILWPPDVKNRPIGKDPDAGKDRRQEEKGTTEDEMVGWHHRRDGHELE